MALFLKTNFFCLGLVFSPFFLFLFLSCYELTSDALIHAAGSNSKVEE